MHPVVVRCSFCAVGCLFGECPTVATNGQPALRRAGLKDIQFERLHSK